MSAKTSSLNLTSLVGGLAACTFAAAMLVASPLPTPTDHAQDAVRATLTAKYQPAVGNSGPQALRARNQGMAASEAVPTVEHCPRCR